MRSDGRALVDSAPGLGVSMRRAEVFACAQVACSVESAQALNGASGTRKSIVSDGQRWFSQLNVGSARRAGVHAGRKWVVRRECEFLICTVTQREIE